MNFTLRHVIFPVGKQCSLDIMPNFPVEISSTAEYAAEITAFSGLKCYGAKKNGEVIGEDAKTFFSQRHALTRGENSLNLVVSFPQEDCYIINLFVDNQKVDRFEVYALKDDLFKLLPFKGDNHMHTFNSDGQDSPEYMAATSCRRGYDYVAITDHYKYEPSKKAKAYYEGLNDGFLIIKGEEVHSPGNNVHIINLGGDKSVNEWFIENPEEYEAEVKQRLSSIDKAMLKQDAYSAAASMAVFDKIREYNGVSILCHPFWMVEHGFWQSEDIMDYLCDHRNFDALELFAGGAYEDGTQMQLSYYKELETMPIVGSSDAHAAFGVAPEPSCYTIVFADELSDDAIKKSIKAGYTVVGDKNKLYGDYRFVKYAYFLLRNLFGLHDRKCLWGLGRHMVRFCSSNEGKDSDLAKEVANSDKPYQVYIDAKYI